MTLTNQQRMERENKHIKEMFDLLERRMLHLIEREWDTLDPQESCALKEMAARCNHLKGLR
jgi:hypothetical protein